MSFCFDRRGIGVTSRACGIQSVCFGTCAVAVCNCMGHSTHNPIQKQFQLTTFPFHIYISIFECIRCHGRNSSSIFKGNTGHGMIAIDTSYGDAWVVSIHLLRRIECDRRHQILKNSNESHIFARMLSTPVSCYHPAGKSWVALVFYRLSPTHTLRRSAVCCCLLVCFTPRWNCCLISLRFSKASPSIRFHRFVVGRVNS